MPLTAINFCIQPGVDPLGAKLIDKIGYRAAILAGIVFPLILILAIPTRIQCKKKHMLQ